MKRLLIPFMLSALSLAAFAACSDNDSDPVGTPTPPIESPTAHPTESPSPTPAEPSPTPTSEPTATPTSEPAPGAPGHALGTRTGDPRIDAFLDMRENGNVESLGNLLVYRQVPCVPPATAEYDVACPDGVAEGTLVSVFVHSACHGVSTPEYLRDNFAKALTEMPLLVHTLYSTPGHTHPTEIDPPDRDLALVLVNTQFDWYSVFWFNDAGSLTDISFGCGHDLDTALTVWNLTSASVLFAAP